MWRLFLAAHRASSSKWMASGRGKANPSTPRRRNRESRSTKSVFSRTNMMPFPCFALAAIGAFLLAFLAHRFLLALNVVDRPNDRSSHAKPTVRGGGIAILVVIVIGASFLLASGKAGHSFL